MDRCNLKPILASWSRGAAAWVVKRRKAKLIVILWYTTGFNIKPRSRSSEPLLATGQDPRKRMRCKCSCQTGSAALSGCDFGGGYCPGTLVTCSLLALRSFAKRYPTAKQAKDNESLCGPDQKAQSQAKGYVILQKKSPSFVYWIGPQRLQCRSVYIRRAGNDLYQARPVAVLADPSSIIIMSHA